MTLWASTLSHGPIVVPLHFYFPLRHSLPLLEELVVLLPLSLTPFLCMSLVRLAESQLPLVVKVEFGAQGSSAELNFFINLAEIWAYSGLLMFQSVLF